MTPNADYEVRLHRVTLPICNLCMQGIGEECHVPGCSFWMCRPPKLNDYMVESMSPVTSSGRGRRQVTEDRWRARDAQRIRRRNEKHVHPFQPLLIGGLGVDLCVTCGQPKHRDCHADEPQWFTEN